MDKTVEWTGQRACDYCGKEAPTMYDAATREGPWAFMCPECWGKHGFGTLGTGFGQRYDLAPDGRLVKTEG